jgi:uncharacterized membrane protein
LMALVDQKTNARQGLANSVLYPLAAKQASGGAAVFHDTTSGNNSVPGVTGFSATAGYDRASGLGSVDANLLVNHWTDTSGAPSLSLSASSTSLTVKAGQTVQTTLTTTASGSLQSAVSLTVTGAPTSVKTTFSASTVAAPGSGSTVLSVAASSSVTPGTYALTVTAAGGGQTAKVTISVIIPAPTFTLATSATALSVMAGNSASVSISITPQNGFASTIALSVSGLPSGVTGTFTPASLNGASAAVGSLSLAVAKTVKAGSYSLVISAKSGSVTQTSSLTLTVNVMPSCILASNPATASLFVGQTSTLQLSCGSVQGTFSTPLAVSITGMPAGVTAQASPNTLAAGSATTISLRSASNTTAGKYSLSVTASGSGFTQTLSVPLTVSGQSTFILTAPQSSLVVKTGATGQISVTSLHVGVFNASIALKVTGLPSGVTVSLSKTSLPAPGDGTVVAAFSVRLNG